jgi:hypothetical protein
MENDYDGITHNEIYNELQNKYLETRDKITLGQMYCVAKEAAKNYLIKYCRQRGLRLNLEELSHDSALFVIEQYLKKPAFKVGKISAYIYFGVKKTLFRNKDVEMREGVSYEELMERKENKKRYI